MADLTLKSSLAQGIQAAFSHAGVRIEFDHPIRNSPKLFALKSRELGVRTVLDVGANFGQFARDLRKHRYSGTIVSFEPLSVAHAALTQSAAADAQWRIAPRMALGSANAQTAINISKNLASSSLLPVQNRSVEAAAVTAYTGQESVDVRRLDDVVDATCEEPLALKLDTQGFELQVLEGAERTLQRTALVLSEMSLASLYENGAAFSDVYEFLERSGFRCISLIQGFADNARHELLQVDGVFVRDRR